MQREFRPYRKYTHNTDSLNHMEDTHYTNYGHQSCK